MNDTFVDIFQTPQISFDDAGRCKNFYIQHLRANSMALSHIWQAQCCNQDENRMIIFIQYKMAAPMQKCPYSFCFVQKVIFSTA